MSSSKKLYIYENASKDKDNAFVIRIPNFWKDNVVSWFSNFEALTSNSNLTDYEQANDVISQLDVVDTALVSDITEYPPLNGFYEGLKNRLVSLYKDSDSKIQAMLVVWSSESYKRSRFFVFNELTKSGRTLKTYLDLISLVEYFTDQVTIESTSVRDSQTPDHVKDHNLNQQSSNKTKKTKKRIVLPLCYYHERFGSEAKNCAPPCGFSNE